MNNDGLKLVIDQGVCPFCEGFGYIIVQEGIVGPAPCLSCLHNKFNEKKGKVSSPEMSSLASKIIRSELPTTVNEVETLLENAKSLAGSVMSQDEDS